jgi:hypothetical protein
MKKLPFKKGMAVVWLTRYHGQIRVTEGEVTVVTTKDGAPVVHVRHPDNWGGYWKRSFSPVAGMFQENPYPIWQLIPLDGKSIKNLTKRAEHASKLFSEYQQKCEQIRRECEHEARRWQEEQYQERIKDLENGTQYLNNVVARLGFKKPKEVKVKVNGKISSVGA